MIVVTAVEVTGGEELTSGDELTGRDEVTGVRVPHTNQWLISGILLFLRGDLSPDQGAVALRPRSPGTYLFQASAPFTTMPLTV